MEETMKDFEKELEESYRQLEEPARAEEEEDPVWNTLKEMLERETVVKVKITEAVKAGVVTELEGVRAFIPASQISTEYVEKLEDWVGKKLEARVITVDPEKKKLVLSGKVVARARQAEEHDHKVAMLVPGTVVEGSVESIQTYGAFVDLGDGLTGLVHISQISRKRIKSVNEVLKVGQKVKAQILNTNDGKISLSMKALEEVPEVKAEEVHEAVEYKSEEKATTSLGSLLAGLKFE